MTDRRYEDGVMAAFELVDEGSSMERIRQDILALLDHPAPAATVDAPPFTDDEKARLREWARNADVASAARVLLDISTADRLRVWQAVGDIVPSEFGAWFKIALQALAKGPSHDA